MFLQNRATADQDRLLSGQRGRTLLLLTLGLAVMKITRYILPLLLPAIIVDLSITSFQAGIVLSLINIFLLYNNFLVVGSPINSHGRP